jgi:hypothetical protein
MSQYLFDNGRLSRFVSNGYINVCVFFSYEWMVLMKKLKISRQVGVPSYTSLIITEWVYIICR